MTHADPVAEAQGSFVKAEPVLAAHLAAAVVFYTLTLLVTRHVITTTEASALTQQVLPGAVALATLLLGFINRHFVTPAAKFAEKVEAEVEARLTGAPSIGYHAAF